MPTPTDHEKATTAKTRTFPPPGEGLQTGVLEARAR